MDIHIKRILGIITAVFCTFYINVSAEIHQNNAFLYADNIVAGIGPDGAFGSNVVAPTGPFMGRKIGYASDPSRNKFSENYDGDFFLPGFPEEGWAVTVEGVNYNNNSNLQVLGVDGLLSNFQEKDNFNSVEWNGVVGGLEIKKTYKTYSKGIAIIIDLELLNSSADTLTDVFYMRTVDPDNNAENAINPTGIFSTKNTIIQQGDEGTAAVKATQADGSIVTLSGYTKRARVSHGGQSVRDPVAAYNGTNGQNTSGTVTEDSSISLSIKFDVIEPGEKKKVTLSYALAHLTPPTIRLDEDNSSGLTNGNFKQVYPLATNPVSVADEDAIISSSTSETIEALKVRIVNPYRGDKISIAEALPNGISIDNDEINNDTEISLIGTATSDDYIKVLKAIRFGNQENDADLTTREIVFQVFDDTYSLSNSSEASVFITLPVIINTPITTDNIINQEESNESLLITGTAASNADIELTLTDTEGNILTKNIVSNGDGEWQTNFSSTELKILLDGTISIDAKSIDSNGHKTTTEAQFSKDTTVNISITNLADNALLNAGDLIIEGQGDQDALISVTTNHGKTCDSVVNSNGNWSCTISSLIRGQEFEILATATDPLSNTATTGLNVSVSNLPLTIISPQKGSIVDDESPLITGQTDPNVDISLVTEIGYECKTISDANGDWTCHFGVMPIGGPHNLTAIAKDTVNNLEAMLLWNFSIEDRDLLVDRPENNQTIKTKLPFKVEGTANPNAEIKVMGPNDEVYTTLSDENGKWSCNLQDILTGDNQEIIVSTINTDGTKQEVVRVFNLEIDDGAVETILKGGGSIGLLLITFLMLFMRKTNIKIKSVF